jgi:AraC-like DNA-binding protein
VRGPETKALGIAYPAGSTFVGLRFRPGVGAAVLGVPATELVNRRVPLSALWGNSANELAEQLDDARSLGDVRARIETAIGVRLLAAATDPLAEAVAARVGVTAQPVRSLAAELGVSERQLRRRCHYAFGYGPKTLERIARFQRFRTLASREKGLGLAQLALRAGYADQPHLTRECRRLADYTPCTLLVNHPLSDPAIPSRPRTGPSLRR